jgi:transcriptional regulator with XRE-family HTH domain
MTREAVAALCGRSEEWLRQIERGRRGTSLHMITRLAVVLKVGDLNELLGDDAPTAVYARPEHPGLTKVRRALTAPGGADDAPPLADLQSRVRQAWRIRSVSGRDRTDLAAVLPQLLVDAQRRSRLPAPAPERRAAYQLLAEVYHLGQLYLCYQDASELLWVVVDRAMAAAQLSEDPAAIARAAWFSAYLYRDFGVVDQAHQVVEDALAQLDTLEEQSPVLLRQRSVVQLASAWNHARDGRPALAWRAWDAAVDADQAGAQPASPHALFGATIPDVALALDVELGKTSSAVRRAEGTDPDAVESVPRRTRLMIEAARSFMLRREHASALYLLQRANATSPEATLYSMYAQRMVHDLRAHAGPMHRRQIADLAEQLGASA